MKNIPMQYRLAGITAQSLSALCDPHACFNTTTQGDSAVCHVAPRNSSVSAAGPRGSSVGVAWVSRR